ncbi:MAG: undecaprenyl/decaprenyl-phosphate alpha-N-acetylglucosaminyl 1-phosphate transferase [Clostridia bacterium]|nr:undecaprenyl/decaprenyl-phosphate alpha-N-acetylglucosaminyl 1-phosphate transferase [Clostridia bacterium]
MTERNGLFIVFAFVVALIMTYAATPISIKLAFKIGALDIPKDGRRMHKKPIPRIGGLAIVYGFLISVCCFSSFMMDGALNMRLVGTLIGAFIIAVLGFLDDLKPKPALLKFAIQIIAASIPVLMGVRVIAVANPINNLLVRIPEWLSIGGSIMFIVGVTNAVNLIDGLDGLAAGVSSIAAVALLSILIMQHNANATMLILAAALAGACFGFLPFNFNPAKTFMGDTGATFLGFILACISIQGPFKTYVAFALPFIILGLPIFDTLFAIVRRMLKGQGIMTPDRGHLHHRLIDMGFSQRSTVFILYGLSAILAISAIVMFVADVTKALMLFASIVLFVVLIMLTRNTDVEKLEEDVQQPLPHQATPVEPEKIEQKNDEIKE